VSVGTNHWSVGRSLNPAFLVDGFIYVVAASAASSTTNSGGRSEGIHTQTIVQLTSGDYIEIWGANTTNTDDFTGESLSTIITAL